MKRDRGLPQLISNTHTDWQKDPGLLLPSNTRKRRYAIRTLGARLGAALWCLHHHWRSLPGERLRPFFRGSVAKFVSDWGAYCARGINGQVLYIDPKAEIVTRVLPLIGSRHVRPMTRCRCLRIAQSQAI